jgi:hypothetical protein
VRERRIVYREADLIPWEILDTLDGVVVHRIVVELTRSGSMGR